MKPVGPAKWPYNPAVLSSYPYYRNQDGAVPQGYGDAPSEASLTPSADQPPEEVPGDELLGEADDQGSE